MTIKRIKPEKPLVDIFNGFSRFTVDCLDKGFVSLLDVMPRILEDGDTCDSAIVQAARVSYGAGTKAVSDDAALIRYLMRHRHTSVFEMVEFKFHIKMPIFIVRQFFRHRMASINEQSGRYSVLQDEFFRPDVVRAQSANNKQGSEGEVSPEYQEMFGRFLDTVEGQYKVYEELVTKGNVSRELARIGLPINLYSEFYWKIDLHNLLHLLSLRLDAHAQEEIRVFAQAINDLVKQFVPVTVQAFEDYRLNAVTFSAVEIGVLQNILIKAEVDLVGYELPLYIPNNRERSEFLTKLKKLGFEGNI